MIERKEWIQIGGEVEKKWVALREGNENNNILYGKNLFPVKKEDLSLVLEYKKSIISGNINATHYN